MSIIFVFFFKKNTSWTVFLSPGRCPACMCEPKWFLSFDRIIAIQNMVANKRNDLAPFYSSVINRNLFRRLNMSPKSRRTEYVPIWTIAMGKNAFLCFEHEQKKICRPRWAKKNCESSFDKLQYMTNFGVFLQLEQYCVCFFLSFATFLQ